MFGKLSLSSIPFDQPIVMWTLAGVVIMGAFVLGAVTY